MRKKKYFLDDEQVVNYILDAVIMYGMTKGLLWKENLSTPFYKMLMDKGFLAETVRRIHVRTKLYDDGSVKILINEIGQTYLYNRFILKDEQLPKHVKGRLNDITK